MFLAAESRLRQKNRQFSQVPREKEDTAPAYKGGTQNPRPQCKPMKSRREFKLSVNKACDPTNDEITLWSMSPVAL
jgi:hypothetical protein